MHSLRVRCRGTEGTGDSRRRAKGIIQPDTNPAAPLTHTRLAGLPYRIGSGGEKIRDPSCGVRDEGRLG